MLHEQSAAEEVYLIIIYMFRAFYGFAQSIECATQSRNSYNACQSIDCCAFYRKCTFDSIEISILSIL